MFLQKGEGTFLRQFIQSEPLKKEILEVPIVKKNSINFFDKVLSFGQYPIGITNF